MQVQSLFEPYILKEGVSLRNRIVMAPMTTWSGTSDGYLSDEEEAYYAHRASGPGMIISAACAIDINAQAFTGQISARSDAFNASLKRLAAAIKSKGAKAILQIHHGGRMNPPNLHPEAEVVSAGDIPAERPGAVKPRELSVKEIEVLIDKHVEVTQRAYHCGFDGVELHGANTYLLQQFVSPHSNRRKDKWGGSRENRMRFPLEIVRRVSLANRDFDKPFILGYRFSPEEIEQPGISIDDTCSLVDHLCTTALDYLHISLPHFAASSIRSANSKEALAKPILATIRQRKPLIGVGRIQQAEDVEEALALGYPLLAIGSSLLANPDWVERLQAGQEIADELHERELDEKKIPQSMFAKLYQLHKQRGNWPGIRLVKD